MLLTQMTRMMALVLTLALPAVAHAEMSDDEKQTA